jgi:hypothetical protein
MPIFQHRSNPPSYSDYRSYKPLLRQDFANLCAYCLLHEGDEGAGGFHAFQIDHFRPVEHFPQLEVVYDNLYYCCHWCNRAKWDTWPSAEEETKQFRFVDPCIEDFYKNHARLNASTGKLDPLSNPGDYTIREIRLNRGVFNKLRRKRIVAQEQIQQIKIRVSKLKSETRPKLELISALEHRIRLLDERYVNPKVPYEPPDLLVEGK